MSAHGGYLLRPEGLRSLDLVELARSALGVEGEDPAESSIQVSVLRSQGVLRVAYDAPFTYGRRGALWYRDHHAFARLASELAPGTAHAYAIDADIFEAVISYAAGRKVGGETVVYDDLEMDFGDDEESLKVTDFEQMRARWPIGHLGQIFGVTRDDLLHLPWHESVLLKLPR
ncbi:MAG TPA: hypothetical protein VIG99_00855 [Myxococcaceae bacterium]